MKYGSEFSATDDLKRARGTSHNAAVRGYANLFDLATQGGTTETLFVGALGVGCVFDDITIETDANLSGVNFTVGTPEAPAKYGAALAGPNSAAQTRRPPLATKLDVTSGREQIVLTPSAALPIIGTIRTKIRATHR